MSAHVPILARVCLYIPFHPGGEGSVQVVGAGRGTPQTPAAAPGSAGGCVCECVFPDVAVESVSPPQGQEPESAAQPTSCPTHVSPRQ